MIIYCMATEADLDELALMRWDFRLEEAPGATVHDQVSFLDACTAFLRQGLNEQRWTYWVAQENSQIISHIYILRIAHIFRLRPVFARSDVDSRRIRTTIL